MPNLNKVLLMGHLTRDPQTKFLPNNLAVCECGIAVSDKWKDKDGNKKERTCFIDFAIFGKSGEAFAQYAAKGRAVFLEAKLKFDQWDDKNGGGKRSKISLLVDNWQLLGEPTGKRDTGEPPGKPQTQRQPPRNPNALYEQAGGDASDIPFLSVLKSAILRILLRRPRHGEKVLQVQC